MKSSLFKTAGLALSIAVSFAFTPSASAGEEASTIREASAPIITAPVEPGGAAQPASAGGTTWAPGGAGAENSLYVKGTGVNVETASVAYFPGSTFITQNACVDEFEIAYYEYGNRVVQKGFGACAPGRVTHEFFLYSDMDAYTPFCGRVRVGDTWGNYACIEILP